MEEDHPEVTVIARLSPPGATWFPVITLGGATVCSLRIDFPTRIPKIKLELIII